MRHKKRFCKMPDHTAEQRHGVRLNAREFGLGLSFHGRFGESCPPRTVYGARRQRTVSRDIRRFCSGKFGILLMTQLNELNYKYNFIYSMIIDNISIPLDTQD